MLPFSLTKYSAIFAEVKGYFGNNNQLGNVEIPASVESSKWYFGICVDRSNRNNQLGSSCICVDRSGCNNQLVVVDADLDEEAVKVDEINEVSEPNEPNKPNEANETNVAIAKNNTNTVDKADDTTTDETNNAIRAVMCLLRPLILTISVGYLTINLPSLKGVMWPMS